MLVGRLTVIVVVFFFCRNRKTSDIKESNQKKTGTSGRLAPKALPASMSRAKPPGRAAAVAVCLRLLPSTHPHTIYTHLLALLLK